MSLLSILSSTCPLLLCAIGALFSEYAGLLALFIEGIICFSGFLTFTITTATHSVILGTIITLFISVILILLLSILVEKFKAHPFIAGLAINLLLGSITTFLSTKIFGNQGVLTSPDFSYNSQNVKIVSLIITIIVITAAILFLSKTKAGLYIRITGSDPDVLTAKGVNPAIFRIASWCASAAFASLAGSLLVFRISSYVPNISSGRGWMALAAVFLGKKKPWKICIAVLIFCAADIFATNVQNFIPQIPSYVLLSMPYLIMIILIFIERRDA